MPGGDFENPEGNPPGSRAEAEARAEARGPGGLPEGFSKSPTGRGDRWRRFPTKNPNLVHIFYKNHLTSTNNHAVKISTSYLACLSFSKIIYDVVYKLFKDKSAQFDSLVTTSK